MNQIRTTVLLGLFSASAAGAQVEPLPHRFHVGDKVEWQDHYYKYGGGWVPGTIVEERGAVVEPYVVHLDGKTDYENQETRASYLRPRGGGTAEAHGARAGTTPQSITRQGGAAAGAPAYAQAPRSAYGDITAYPRRPEGRSQVVVGADGQRHLRSMVGPGDEMPIGRWILKTGGQSVLTNSRVDPGGRTITETHTWTPQARSNVLTISANGTWTRTGVDGKRDAGRWNDLGDNIIELVGYEGETWTASVWKGELQVKHPVGKLDWGRRG